MAFFSDENSCFKAMISYLSPNLTITLILLPSLRITNQKTYFATNRIRTPPTIYSRQSPFSHPKDQTAAIIPFSLII